LPTGVLVAAGAVLVVGGVALGIWLAPKGGGPAVAAPISSPPPTAISAAPTAPPSVATQTPTAPTTEIAPASAPASIVVAENTAGGSGGAEEATDAHDGPRVQSGNTGPKVPRVASQAPPPGPAPASRPSAFAGLDAARGDNAANVPTKKDRANEDLPPGLDQVEISAVIKRNIKAVQGCYQRQLKRDDSMADGRATIRFRIQADGHARDVDMDRRFTGTVLRQCIVNTVERWAFPPFEGDPIPVEFPVIFTATF
jgi:hypothetical protein